MAYNLRPRFTSAAPPQLKSMNMAAYPKRYDAYQIEKKLGEGSFAEVHLASLKTNKDKKVALKLVKVELNFEFIFYYLIL